MFVPLISKCRVQGQALIDSLIKLVPTAKEDSNKAIILFKLGAEYRFINADEGIKYATEEVELAQKIGWQTGIGIGYLAIAANYFVKPDYPKALEYDFKALEFFEKRGDKEKSARCILNVANVYHSEGDNAKALQYNFKALEIMEKIGNKQQIASDLGNIGEVYASMKDDKKALEYYLKSLAIFKELGNKADIAPDLINIGSIYSSQADYSKALDYFGEALQIGEELGNTSIKANALGGIGGAYLEIAKKASGAVVDKQIVASQRDNLKKASDFLTRALSESMKISSRAANLADYQELSETYSLLGDYKRSLEYYREYTMLKDSIFSNDNKVKIANLATQREADLKQKQIEINQLSESKKRNERSLYMVGLGLLSLTVVVVGRNYNNQKNANREKEQLLKQKDMLMKEIHHRVKNNLQVIGALLDLQVSSIADENAKDAMTESTTRVKSISLIHQQLYQNDNITSIEFSKFAEDLLHQVTSVFKKPGQSIALKNEIPETVLDIDTAVPLGLILNELMTNSYKYAFADRADGSIEVGLRRDNGDYRLVYRDSGPGLPKELNVAALRSLGMKVMHSLSKQIGGTFTYDAGGKSFVVVFKDEIGRKLID